MKNYLFSLVATVKIRDKYYWYIPPEYAFEFNTHNLFIEDASAYPSERAAKAAFTKMLEEKLCNHPDITLNDLF